MAGFPRRWPVSPAQHQILDGARTPGQPVAAGATILDGTQGTLWPILPGKSLKIYNASVRAVNTGSGALDVQGLQLSLQLFDNQQNPLTNFGLAIIAAVFMAGTVIPRDIGAAAEVEGDPIIELAAGFQISPAVGPTPAVPAFLQLQAASVVKNSGGVSQGVQTDFLALIAFVDR